MAFKLFKFGPQLLLSNFLKNSSRFSYCNQLNSALKNKQFAGSCIRNLSLSNYLREEEETNEVRDPAKDRSVPIPVETSIRYLQSKAYKEAYGDKPVWFHYRRNFKGQIPPSKTRLSCIRKGQIATGNPCPVCRDEFLVLHYTNTELLKQFISEITGEILSTKITNICQRQLRNLLVEIIKAKDYGTISFDLPQRQYDYQDYLPKGLKL